MKSTDFEPVYFLLVDDLEENLLALEGLLRREGLVLLKATSGTAALELLLKHDIALALIDVQMPEMSGFELAELMRGIERTRTVPIIFLTAGNTDQQRRFRGYGAGVVDFLQKPIESDVLRSKAGVFFELHRRQQEVKRYAQSLEEADRRKDEFLATLAHELRNPLAPIRNGLEILRQQPNGKNADTAREMMERQLKHMVRLIDDLLDTSRISQGKIELRCENITLQSAIRSAVETSRPQIDAGRHKLSIDVPKEDIWLYADMTRLAQAVSNLLNNAAKYTPEGGEIKLVVALDGDSVTIRITDNGIGIPPDMLTKIFSLFEQGNATPGHARGGLGIGLALVRHLVEMHGGTVRAESKGENQGSAFTLRLPVVEHVAEEAAAVSEAPQENSKNLRILVVDDNMDSAQTTAWMLEMSGHKVVQAYDGRNAIARANETHPDAIILDIGLPDMSGYDVCRTLRAIPAFKNTLIIAQTGLGQQNDRAMTSKAGFDHHLVKPVSMQDFTRLLGREKTGHNTPLKQA
jgi:signal transduction histidine kinase